MDKKKEASFYNYEGVFDYNDYVNNSEIYEDIIKQVMKETIKRVMEDIIDEECERIINMPDHEIYKECIENGEDPEEVAEQVKKIFKDVIKEYKNNN